MDDYRSYNHESKAERDARHQRARDITSGERDSAGLTTGERSLIIELRRQGLDIVSGWLVKRDGGTWKHGRIVEIERSA